MTIIKCANCQKDIDLDIYAHTSCIECMKYFCFSMSSTCFTEYHHKNNLYQGHSALSITNPGWTVKLRCSNE